MVNTHVKGAEREPLVELHRPACRGVSVHGVEEHANCFVQGVLVAQDVGQREAGRKGPALLGLLDRVEYAERCLEPPVWKRKEGVPFSLAM
jgi:hypothetical protein